MVKILNGEIVQDNDPRLRNRQTSASAGDVRTAAPAVGGGAGGAAGSGGGGVGGVLDGLARALGVEGKTWASPPVPQLGWRSVDIPLVYLILAAGLIFVVLLSGASNGTTFRVAIGVLLAGAAYIQMQNAARVPGTLPPTAAPGASGGGRPATRR